MEEARNGVHVALVQPGFVATEGFPQRKLLARPWTRWMVSSEDKVVETILDVWRRRRPEAYVPRPYGLVPVARVLLPGLYRRAVGRRRLHGHAQAPRASAQRSSSWPPEGGQALGLGLGGAPGPGGRRPGERLDGDQQPPALGLLAPDAVHAPPTSSTGDSHPWGR